jgi:hypothetical protein
MCLLSLVLTGSLVAQTTTEIATEEGNTVNTRPDSSSPAALKIIQNYITASGGYKNHLNIKSILAKGTITEANLTRSFELIETSEGLRHITYRWRKQGRDHVETMASNGSIVWSQQTAPKSIPAKVIKGAEAVHFINQFWFLNPALAAKKTDFVYAIQGSAKVFSRSTYLVIAYNPQNVRSWFYFDKETFLPIRWGGLGKVAGSEEYLDYRSTRFEYTDGVLRPKAIDLIVENDAFGTINFSSIQSNVEVDQENFELPVYESPVLRQKQTVEPVQ